MKKHIHIKRVFVSQALVLLICFLASLPVLSQTNGDYQTNATGAWTWTVVANWQKRVAGAWVAATDYPGQAAGAGTVTILNNTQVTLNVSPANAIGALTIAKTNASTTSLSFGAAQTLSVTGTTSLTNTGGTTQNCILDVADGVFYTSSISLGNSVNNNSDCNLLVTTGTITVTNDITMLGTANRNNFTFSGAGLLKVGGTITGAGPFTESTGTVEYTSTGAAAIKLDTYYNLTLTNGGAKTLAGDVTVSNNFVMNTGSSLNVGANAFSVSGTSSIDGAFSDNDDVSNNSFTGTVTVTANGTWSTTASTTAARYTFAGGFKNDNTTIGSVQVGGCTFSAAQSISGAGPITFINLDISVNFAVTNVNTNTITVSGVLTGNNNASSKWVNANGSYLIIAGSTAPFAANASVLDASTASNTVKYTNTTAIISADTYYNLIVDDNVSATLAGGLIVANTLLTNPSSTLSIGNNTLTVAATTTINGLFLDALNAGTDMCYFTGKVTVTSSGTWSTTINTATTEGETFKGGFENYNPIAGSVKIGSCNFTTNNQSISGDGPIEFTNSARVSTATFSVTNINTNTITVAATLNGVATSYWVNGAGSYLLITSTTKPMTTGSLVASAVSNTVCYTAAGANVKDAVYSNLIINTSTSATLGAAATVNNFLYLLNGTFTNGANLTMAAGATISRDAGNLSQAPTFGTSVNVIYTAANTTSFEIPVATTVLNNLTLNTNGADVYLGAATTVTGSVIWSSNGLLILQTNNLTVGATATFSGNNSVRFIQTNSTGKLIKQGTVAGDFQIVYPVGTLTNYSPMHISSVSTSTGFGAPGSLSVTAVASRLPYGINANSNAIAKYWSVSTSFSVTSTNVNFTFVNPAELVGAITLYEPRIGNGVTIAAVTGPSATGSTPTFSSTGHTTLTGDWTYVDPTIRIPQTYYTYQSGDWGTANVWTTDPSGTTLVAPAVPGSVTFDNVVILNGRTVYTNVSRSVNQVEIRSGGVLDLKTTTANSFSVMLGAGTLKVKSASLPAGLNNASAFVGTSGGTIEYYDFGGAGTNLSSSQTTYNNLTISNSTGTDNTVILQNSSLATVYTINGSIVTSAASTGSVTLQIGSVATNVITMNVTGSLTNGANCNMTVGNFDAIHTITMTGNVTNNGIIDWCNTAQWVAATAGAINLGFTGASDKTMACNGQTDIYSLTVNIGTDDSYMLDLDASATANFKIFTNTKNITLTKGTLKLGSGLSLVRLGTTGAQYDVNVGCRLWLNGASVLTDTYDDGLRLVAGTFSMTSGVANFSNIGINILNSGRCVISGGTVTIQALINGGNGLSDGTFIMSGGVINIDNSLSGTMTSDLARFSMPDPNSNFTMSGGTINIYDPNNSTDIGSAAVSLGVASANAVVTGGTWNFYIPASAVDFGVASNIPFYDLNIYKEGAGTSKVKLMTIGGDLIVTAKPLVVLHDFTIDGTNSPVFDANGNNVTVGGDFKILTGGTYIPNMNTTTFDGPGTYGRASQTFSINTQITSKTNLVISKSTGTLAIAGSSDFACLSGLTITQGVFDDGGKTIDVCGDIANSSTHIGTVAGSIKLQRGVTSTSITAAGAYALPTVNVTGAGAVTTPATFSLTIKDGTITAISVAPGGGGSYATNNTNRTMAFGSGGATAKCETVGGAVVNVWLISGGSGYGPTASLVGGGGTGTVLEAQVSGTTSNIAGTGALTAVNVLSTGEDITSIPTIAISSGAGTANAVTTATPTISGSGSGVFSNLYQNNDNGSLFSANHTVTKDIRLAKGVMNIGSYNLALSGTSNVYDALAGTTTAFTSTNMIQTNGISSNGGLTKTYSASMLSFKFPLGTGGLYTPGTIALSAAPTSYGSVTIKPVATEHPLVSATGQSLTYYWKTVNSGIVLGPATVTHTYSYHQSDVVDNGGTVLETEYVPGRYNSSSITWTASVDVAKVDDASNNDIIFDEADFITTIDGDYTAGDRTPVGVDPFAAVLTFYSRDVSVGGTYDWNDPNAWSIDATLNHLGAAVGGTVIPTSNSVVKIGDGVTNNHTVVVDADGMLAGSMMIQTGSKLDLGIYRSHNFGTYITGTVGNGTLSISSPSATAEFPAGDFVPFLNSTGGTVEYITTGAQDFTVPAVSASTVNIANYRNLIVTPATGQVIVMPNTDLTVYNNLTIQGTTSTGTVALNSVSTKTLTVNNNLAVNSGHLQFKNAFAQNVVVGADLSVSSGAIFNVLNSGTAIVNTMTVAGTFTNNGTSNFIGGTDVCNITFTNSTSSKITGTNALASTIFNKLTVNKGNSQASELDVDVLGTLTTPSTNWLTLTNGTFKFSKNTSLTIENALSYTINPTVCLAVNNSAATVNVCYVNANVDLTMNGKLHLIDGVLNVGLSTSGSAQDVIYGPTGTPEINIQAGSFYVNGQIRRSSTSTAGDLIYNQAAGSATVCGRNSTAARGRLEVLNNGTFTMGSTAILTIMRAGSTLADLHLVPASSSVSGTIIFGTNNLNVNRDFKLQSSVALNNITVAGFDATNDLVNVDVGTLGLTINGTLNISNNFSAFRANTYSVNFSASGAIVNSNTVATTGISVGGYQAGSTGQITTFNSSTASQTITGIAGNLTNFGALVIANTSGSVTLGASSNIRVNGDLTMTSGVLADGGNTITVIGNVANSSTHSGAGNMTLGGGTIQTLSGNGSGIFQNLVLNNTLGFVTTTNQTVNGVLTFSAGIIDIDDDLLTLGSAATIAGTTNSTQQIITNGAASDLGVLKNFNSGASSFTFPMSGNSSVYTPANFNITANGAVGTINLRPVDSRHLSTQDAGNKELLYYWDVESTGFSGLTATHTYTYDQSDVQGTEASYNTGRYYSNDWVPVHGYTATVNSGNNTMTLAGVNFLDGDYTAGQSDGVTDFEFDALKTYYSRNATLGGNWDDVNSWSTDPIAQHTGTASVIMPNGNPIVIAAGHTITANGDMRVASTATITGVLDLADYVGHNLRTTKGTGTIKINATSGGSFIFPSGNNSLFSAGGAGTFEFGGATNGSILPTLFSLNNITLSGASTKTLATGTYTINGNLAITGGTLSNANNSNINIKGNWTNSVSTTAWVSGTSITTFNGSSPQTIGGSAGSNFYKLVANNTSTTGITLGAPVVVTNSLTLTDGYVYTTSTNLLTLNDNVTSNQGSAASFVSGPLRKIGNDAYVFPVGKNTYWRRVAMTAPTSTSTYFTAEYIPAAYSFTTPVTAPLDHVSSIEYWQFDRSAPADAVKLSLYWEDASYSRINDCSDLTVAHWNGAAWVEEAGTASGSCSGTGSGNVQTNSTVSSFSPFTFGSKVGNKNPLPIELTSFKAKCDGENVVLSWSTATEMNNDYYTLERSSDAIGWETVSTIKGAGTSVNIKNYESIDKTPYTGYTYYRLAQTDFDGKRTYSNIIYVESCLSNIVDIVVQPNPSTGIYNLSIKGDKNQLSSIDVYNVLGENVYHSTKQDLTFNINDKPNGVYFLYVTFNSKVIIKQIVLQQ